MNAFASDCLLTFSEAAKKLGISLRQFRRLVDDGKIPFVRVSERAPRVRATVLESFVSSVTVARSQS